MERTDPTGIFVYESDVEPQEENKVENQARQISPCDATVPASWQTTPEAFILLSNKISKHVFGVLKR